MLVLQPLGAPSGGDIGSAQAPGKLQEKVGIRAAWANFQIVPLVLEGLFDITLSRYHTLPNEGETQAQGKGGNGRCRDRAQASMG